MGKIQSIPEDTDVKKPDSIETLLLQPEKFDNLKHIFDKFDRDKSGFLDKNEFTLFMIDLDKFLDNYLESIKNSNDYEDIKRGILFSKEVVAIEDFAHIEKVNQDKISFDEFRKHVVKVCVNAKTETN